MNIKEILDKFGQGVLTEESVKIITESFDQAVDNKVKERVEIEVKAALEKIDEEHASELQKLIDNLDANHTANVKLMHETIEQDHLKKLEKVIKHFNKIITEDATAFKHDVSKKISDFVDIQIEKLIPKDQIKEAVENKRAKIVLDQVKKLLVLDESFVSATIKEGIEDGKKTIDSLKANLTEAMKQNIKLSQELDNVKASLLIEQKTNNYPVEKKKFIQKILENKNYSFIKENFDYTVKMFEKEQEENVKILAEEAKVSSKTLSSKVDRAVPIEKDTLKLSHDEMDSFVEVLKKKR